MNQAGTPGIWSQLIVGMWSVVLLEVRKSYTLEMSEIEM